MRDWLPVVLWMAAIFWGSSLSALPGPLGAQSVWGERLRDATHVAEYAVLSGLAYQALRATAQPELLSRHGAARAGRLAGATQHAGRCRPMLLALSLAYAVLDETHQHFVPGRQFAVADLLLDAEGSILALAALRALLA